MALLLLYVSVLYYTSRASAEKRHAVQRSGLSALWWDALAPFPSDRQQGHGGRNQISGGFTAAFAAAAMWGVIKSRARRGKEAATPPGPQSVFSDGGKKIPRPINSQMMRRLLAPILSLVIKGLTWRWLFASPLAPPPPSPARPGALAN